MYHLISNIIFVNGIWNLVHFFILYNFVGVFSMKPVSYVLVESNHISEIDSEHRDIYSFLMFTLGSIRVFCTTQHHYLEIMITYIVEFLILLNSIQYTHSKKYYVFIHIFFVLCVCGGIWYQLQPV